MTREIIPYFNATTYGEGLEGTVNYVNSISNYLFIPTFLFMMYGAAIYVFSKSSYGMGGGVFFISFVFFLMAIIFQGVTMFSQLVIFVFFIGMLVGVIMYFIEK